MVVRPQFVGPRVSRPSCLSFALQLALVLQVPVGSRLPYGSHLRDGVTPVGSRLVCLQSERRFSVFPFPFWAVSSCCHYPSGYSPHMGQVCRSVPAYAR